MRGRKPDGELGCDDVTAPGGTSQRDRSHGHWPEQILFLLSAGK